MLSSTEQRYCPSCQHETNHVVVLVDKSYGNEVKAEQKRTAFIKDFITRSAAGPFLANMDRFERHTICENCGNKVIDEGRIRGNTTGFGRVGNIAMANRPEKTLWTPCRLRSS